MGCVNRNGKEFKALAARNNVASNTLELLTHKYWLETGNETLFPSDVYIQAQLGNGHYLEKGKNVRALWKMQYNSPKEFASMGALQSAYKEASKYFPETAIVYYKNAKGNFMLSVKRPVEKADYTKDEFFDEFDNMGSMKDVKKFDLGIKEKQVYGIDKVQELYNKFNTDKTSQALADRAFNIAKELGLQITFDESLPFGIFGRYTNNNTLRFKKSFLEGDMMNSEKAPIMLHEVLHALSMYALSDQTKNWKRSENLEGFRTEMNSLYQNLKSNPLLKGERGIVDLYEFVAELANPVFRSKIQQVDKEVKAKKSFWSRVLDAFKKLLGLHTTNTYYQRSMNALEKALDAFDIDTYMRYNGTKKTLRDGYNAKEWEFNSMSDAEVKSNVSNYFDKKVYNAELQSLKEKAIADGTFMKAPNGKDTKLTERQWLQVRTKAFKDWFGDWENNPKEASKIVDENGEPLIVYHGGENNVSSFITYHQDSEVGDMYGAYFTKDKKYAKSYNRGTLYEVFLNIREPLATEGSWTGIISKGQMASITAKHDGIVNDKFDNGILQKLHLAKTRTEIIVFNPNQIKSATNNNGEFSTTNPEIQNYELAKEVTDSMSGEQLKDELSLIKQESADYGIVNGIEEEHKHSGKAVPTVFMFADGTKVQAPFRPNAQQVDALNAMDRFMKSNETSMTLSGYAGTGKTSLMELIAKKGQMQYRPVVFCASTNKAAAVLKNRVSKAGFDASTLNKIFGIQVEVDPNSKSYNAKNLVNKVKDPSEIDIIPGTTVIIDEASMINEENYNILNRIAKQKSLKIIYVGDEAQLAPVNEDKISKVFRNGEGKVIRLTQVERTDDNAILKEATDIRNGKPLSRESSFNSKGEGVAYISPEHQDVIDEVIEHYVKGLKQDPNYFRILAYTNKAVAAYNNQVRELLGYNTPVPQRGEPMTGYINTRYNRITKTYDFVNSESYKVVYSGNLVTKSIVINGVTYRVEAFPITLENPVGDTVSINYMDIKSNRINRNAAEVIGREKARLWVQWRKATSKYARDNALAQIHKLEEFLFVNDDIKDENSVDETGQHPTLVQKAIDFGYAMTVHKSQGSTFTHVLMDDVDIARGSKGNDMFNVWSVDLGEESTNDPSTAQLKSTSDVDLGDLGNTEEESTTNNTVNKRQQLEYVSVSRATDTVTVISSGIKKEGSPLHPESAVKEDKSTPQQANQNTIPEQLISHLKSQGINVKDRVAMEEFLKTHKLEYLQQYINKYSLPKGELSTLSSTLMTKYGNKTAYGDVIQTANYEYTVNYKGAGEFDIIEYHQIDNNLKDKINDKERRRVPGSLDRLSTRDEITKGEYPSDSYNAENREADGDNAGLDKQTSQGESNQTSSDVSGQQHQEWTEIKRDSVTGRISFVEGDGRTISTAEDWNFPLFATPQGEVYGFVDKEGNIYLDETKITPEHPIHEYTHLWDRTVQQKNPKLWQRGVELMKQTPLWNEILNDANYGKVWQSMNLPQEKLDNLIASEVHARFTGEGGEKLLNQIAEKQGQSGIIAKLKQWILDVWKDLKATFGNWSQEDLDKLTLKDFNHMPVRDLAEGVDIRKLADINSTEGTQNDSERFNNNKQSQTVISSNKTILSNDELKYWNSKGVGEEPRILVASEHSDPAFHVAEILRVLEGKRSVTTWQKESFTGKDFAGLYLITKQDGLPLRKLLETKIPKLIHFSITGLGGTEYEPGVMKYNDLLDRIQDYIKQGLDPECVTIRIDPIVPGVTKESDIEAIVKRASEMGIKRIRFSVMDAYPKTIEAMEEKGLNYDFETYYGINNNPKYKSKYNFNAKKAHLDKIADFMLSLKDKYDITLGTCAEPLVREGIKRDGCLSVAAVNNMLGTSIVDKGTANNGSRKWCSCYGGKSDALAYASSCASHCIYCYAKHSNDTTLKYYNEDGSLKDNVYTRTQGTVKDLIRDKRQAKTTQQKQQVDWARTSSNGYEVSTRGDRRFSALVATFKPGTIIDGVDVGGKTIEHVYQNVIKKSSKGKAPAKNSKLYNESLKTNEEREDFSYQKGYLPLWKEWAKQNPELMAELKEKSQGKVLTDQFANTRVSQARALAEILNESKVKDSTQDTTVENPSIAEGKTMTVELPNYEYFNDLYEDTSVDAEWKIPYLKELDAQLSLETPREESINIINQMDKILQSTSEEEYKQELNNTQEEKVKKTLDDYDKINQQLNNLLDNEEGLTATDLRHVAQQIADELSDLITQVQSEKGLAAIQYPSVKTNIDFMTASRKEIVKAIGIDNMLLRAQKIFEVTDRDDSDVMAQAFLICDNWDALVSMASDAFAFNEGFGIRRDYSEGHYKVTDDSTVDYDNFSDYSNDADVNAEEGGKDEQEHWQIENRTIDVLNSMSALVRQGIHECYVLDADGNKVISKWGIAERVNPRNATNSILRWTQGSLSMDDMINKLSEKQKHNPWLSQLVERLSDKTGKETDFQSQFYGVFQKHFQPYSIVLLEDGKYHSIPVNSHPALTEAMNSISAQFKIGEHSLFAKTRINARDLGSKNTTGEKAASNLYKSLYEMQEVKKALKTGGELTSELADKFTRNVLAVCHILNYNITEDMISDITNEENVDGMTTALSFMVQNLTKAKEALASNKIKEYDPFKYYGDYNIRGELSKFLAPVTEKLEDVAISAFYDSGKMYQSYVTPSFMTKLMSKFKQPRKDFEKFMMEEYGSSEWFKDKKEWRYKDGWRIEWLQKLATDDTMRQMFDHKVELNFNKHNYMRTMSDSEYALSLITEYYSDNADLNADMAPSWYRVPMQSNKPSSEFIRFYSYRGNKETYKENIVDGLQQMVNQELSRIQTVRMRNLSKSDNGFIKNFDTNGRKFCFFPVLNSYLENTETAKAKRKWLPTEAENNRLAELLQMKVGGKEIDEGELKQLLHGAIRNSVEARVQDILEKWEKAGILEAAKNIKGIYPKDYDKFKNKEERDSYINPYVRDQVENFLWNDTFASKNILQLTLTDIAFYKDAEDLQKRLAQLHAPGIRGRIDATDYNGKRVSDGRYRTLVLKDFDNFKSSIIANITEVFDRKIRNAKSDAQKKQLEALKDSLVRKPGTLGEKDKGGKYWNINVADAQGFSSPASYRKKALIFGKWSKHAEKIYQKLQNNDYNYTDLETAFQPLKPFVYSKLEKNLGVEGAPITTMHVPFQAKNAEYLLIMADALLKGEETSRPNLLRAIYRVMEDSEKLCPTKGIDTVQFESAIKSSLQGAMDIAQYREMEGGEEAAYTFMKNQIFKEEYNQKGERVYQNYNTDTFVHETSYEDYCLQQEVPEHFKEHSQAHGSQIRMITPSDLDFFTTDENGNQVDNYYEWTEPDPNNPGKTIQRKVKADEFRREYEQTIADNVKESIETLAKELCLTGEKRSRKEQNIALAKILQREILSSPRYGIDLIQACSIDKETGEFRIPKGDPIQAKRIEQLINSIIKNRINKQKIAGGPIVQVSNFGTSKQLHIRFKDKKTNGLLPLEEEYNPSEHNGISYKDYCAKYQGGIAHFEVYMPIWSDDLFKKFGKPDGTIDVEAIEALDPELLKMVSYRIPTEDKYSCAPMKVVGFMPREAGDAIMLPYELTEIDDSDFDVDKRYVMRKDIPIKEKNSSDYMDELTAKAKELYKKYNKYEAEEKYMDRLISDIIDHPNRISVDTEFRKELMKEYRRLAFSTEAPTSGKTYRDNKIVDMTYAVLSNEMTADKILNPGGFDAPKKMGYMVAAYKNNSNVTWNELEGKSIDALKDLCYTDKDLTYADTQVQFYKQNAAAASLIGVFAVNKVAHATLESNNIWLDVSEICGENPFYIAVDSYDRKEDPKTGGSALVVNGGTTLGGRIQIDKKYDSEGNLIGKTLGSLVSASADAVKDPILNLMNINMTTAGMLNTMLRLGMPFNDAALFLSQDIIGRTLNQFNKENLNNYKSLDEIIEGWLKAYRDKNGISEDSNINTEPLTKDELVEGITDKEHEATDYKVLLAFQKLRNLTDAMRNPTYITRFNSISSAVGPLIIDNLIMEHKLNTFNENVPKSGTHFYNAETEGAMINMYDIFAEHPLLEQFHRTVGMAKTLFHDMPTGSTGFRNLMSKLDAEHSDIADKLYRDKKLFDQFANFYQSYLLIASGVINPNSLSNYVNGFAKWFMDQKYAEKYPENELIKAIKMNVTKASNRPFLTINTTGADEQVKEVLRSGWIDLHKADPVLSQRLFEYSFFRAGIGFSPKTFMSLVPTYVKERIKSKDGKSSYVDTYRNFPDVSMHFDRIIEQFVRNNWDNNKLAPYRGDKDTKYTIDVPHGRLTVWREEDKASVRGLSYIKTKGKGGTTNLWKKVSKESDSDIVFNLVKPLGNNGEYLEMNLNDITAPLSDTTKTAEDNVASAFEENGAVQDSTEETPTSPITDTEATKQVSELAQLMMKLNPDWTVETANRNIEKIKSDDKQLWKSRKFLQNVFKQKGLELSEQEAMDKFKEMC